MKPGTWNVLKTGEPGVDLDSIPYNDRLMLGMSVDESTAATWLQRYRDRYGPRGATFTLVSDAPPTTCEIPTMELIPLA